MGETDLISRQAAIEAIKTWGLIDGLSEGEAIEILADEEKLPSAPPKKVCVAEIKVDIDDIKDYIDKAINAERWIPCSERLPDTNGDYLVTGRQGAVNKRRFEDGRWYGGWAILAWMPLPEPYKGEQE